MGLGPRRRRGGRRRDDGRAGRRSSSPATSPGRPSRRRSPPASITDAEVAAANKDGAVGTVGMRTLGAGAAQAMPGNTHARRDQRACRAARPQLAARSRASPSRRAATDAATKQYVDAVAQGLAPKDSVRCATTARDHDLDRRSTAADVVDGITLANGDRVLVKNQAAPAENGIYVVAASPARATDADAWAELPARLHVRRAGHDERRHGLGLHRRPGRHARARRPSPGRSSPAAAPSSAAPASR